LAEPIAVVTAESVTQLDDVAGKVLVAGSHGGIIAAYLGATAGVHALILNDAGLGKDRAGIAGLFYLEQIGMAAAAVDCMSARIGDGADMLARGIVSHANVYAALCGVAAGQSCLEAAKRLREAAAPRSAPPPYAEGRWRAGGQAARGGGPPKSGRSTRSASSGRRMRAHPRHRLARRAPRRQAWIRAGPTRQRRCSTAGVGADRIGITRLPSLRRAEFRRLQWIA
jgi:hypothetical protein